MWKSIQKANIHNRHKTFLWHIISNVLPTRDRLSRIPEIEDKSCPICHNEDKTISNLFLNAPLVRQFDTSLFGSLDQNFFSTRKVCELINSVESSL